MCLGKPLGLEQLDLVGPKNRSIITLKLQRNEMSKRSKNFKKTIYKKEIISFLVKNNNLSQYSKIEQQDHVWSLHATTEKQRHICKAKEQK